MATKRTRNGKTWYEDVVYHRVGSDEHGEPKYRREWIRGRTRSECAKTKQAAIDERDGKPRAEQPDMLLQDLYRLVKERHVARLRPKSQYVWRAASVKRISKLFHYPIGNLTTEIIDQWMSDLAAEKEWRIVNGERLLVRVHGDRSINLARGCLVTTLNKGKKWGYVGERNVAEHADRFREDTRTATVYTPQEVASIALAAQTRRLRHVGQRGYAARNVLELRAARDMSMVFVLAFGGLRISELCALRWKNIHPTFLLVEHSLDWEAKDYLGPVKTGKARQVPLLPETRRALEWWRELATHTDRLDFIFSSEREDKSTPMNRDGWRSEGFNKAALEAGFPEARPHFMRHTFVSLMRRWAFSSSEVADFIGDTEAVVNKIYTQSYTDDLAERLTKVSSDFWGP
jgi:integrase